MFSKYYTRFLKVKPKRKQTNISWFTY